MEGSKSDEELNDQSDPLYKNKRRSLSRGSSGVVLKSKDDQGEKSSRKGIRKSKQMLDESDSDEDASTSEKKSKKKIAEDHNRPAQENKSRANSSNNNSYKTSDDNNNKRMPKQIDDLVILDEKADPADGAGEFVDIEEEKPAAPAQVETVQSMDELLGRLGN